MSHDRPRRPRSGGSSAGGRTGQGGTGRGRPGQEGRAGGRAGGRPGSRPGGRDDSGRRGGRDRSDDSRGSRGGRPGDRDSRGRNDRGRPPKGRRTVEQRREEYGGRPEPRTEAERRAEQVRKTRGPRRTERTPEREREQIEARETEQWIDEGSVRDAATAATKRASRGDRGRQAPEVDPEVVAEIHAALDPQRAARLSERLASASAALDRERFDEARRMIAPLVRELPQVAAVHEVNGLAAYRTGRWRHAAQSLELARQLKPDPTLLPALADSYRALKRWDDVDAVWRDVRAASPQHDVMAEARIVVASSHADRGDLSTAIKLMVDAQRAPKKVRMHHLRQWYVLADFYDRAGDTVAAARWFRQVADHDPHFGDVRDRLRSLGR